MQFGGSENGRPKRTFHGVHSSVTSDRVECRGGFDGEHFVNAISWRGELDALQLGAHGLKQRSDRSNLLGDIILVESLTRHDSDL